MAAVSFARVSKAFPGGVHAVRDLSLDAHDGELLVLVGPSGCGKTTTLRLIAGLEQPTGGEIRLGGQRINELAPAERDVAMVFQHDALSPHLSVRQNLAFGLQVRRTPRADADRRIADAAAALGLAELLDRLPAQLSGGQRQRVALGRAIVRQPRAFLFDEPLSHLDPQLREQLRGEIAALHRRLGVTTIVVTHDQREAMTLGQRVAVMRGGQLQQVGEPLEIYRRPANRFVAEFIGSPAMSFLAGELRDDGALHVDGLRVPIGAATRGRAALGFRPEHVSLAGDGIPLGRSVLDAVEQLGHESIGYCQLAGVRVALRLPAEACPTPGAAIQPRLRAGAWHLFAADADGRRLDESPSLAVRGI
jgi:sn-glycerol 3-phosphate transport system ATP-binding protein